MEEILLFFDQEETNEGIDIYDDSLEVDIAYDDRKLKIRMIFRSTNWNYRVLHQLCYRFPGY